MTAKAILSNGPTFKRNANTWQITSTWNRFERLQDRLRERRRHIAQRAKNWSFRVRVKNPNV